MNPKIIGFSFFFLLSILSFRLNAQREEFVDLYKRIFDNISQASSFSTDCRVDIFLQKEPSNLKAAKSINASLRISGGSYYYKVFQMEYLYTKNLSVLLDQMNKKIVYSQVEQDASKLFKQYTPSLDSLLAKNDSLRIKKSASGESYYTLYASKNVIYKTDLYFNSTKTFISKLVYYYNPRMFDTDQSVVVYYSNTRLNDNEISMVPISKFLQKKGGSYVAASAYSDYIVTEVKKL